MTLDTNVVLALHMLSNAKKHQRAVWDRGYDDLTGDVATKDRADADERVEIVREQLIVALLSNASYRKEYQNG